VYIRAKMNLNVRFRAHREQIVTSLSYLKITVIYFGKTLGIFSAYRRVDCGLLVKNQQGRNFLMGFV